MSGAPAEAGAGTGGADTGAGAPAVGGEAGQAGGSGGAPLSEGGAAGQESGGEGGAAVPLAPGAPLVDTEVKDQSVDVFGTIGNSYWFIVSDTQLQRMNEGGMGGPGPEGDIYVPGGSSATYVDHLLVTTPGENSTTADYGKTKVRVVGQSTYRPWTPTSIPNLNVESDEFAPKQRIGGYEHLRFGNGQVGSIYRERITLMLYDLLGYPAPKANFAWVSSNVWSENIKIPYTVVERYKPDFCERNAERLGGGCVNMWEFVGDLNGGGGFPGGPIDARFVPPRGDSQFDDPSLCQFNECDPTRVKEFESTVASTPTGEGFKAALEDWIDWPMFHRFQCLSWILVTGDDALHNTNNVVLVERSDGKFGYLPYSVDISLGQDWYPEVELPGQNLIARGCQTDTSCWADTIATCEDVIAELIDLDPVALVDEVHQSLQNEGMIRSGDEQRYRSLRAWFESRLVALPEEIEWYREPPVVCDWPLVDCGGYCDYYENCGQCQPPVGKRAFAPEPGMGGAGGAGGDDGGVGGEVGAAGGGGKPGECPMITNYAVDPN